MRLCANTDSNWRHPNVLLSYMMSILSFHRIVILNGFNLRISAQDDGCHGWRHGDKVLYTIPTAVYSITAVPTV